MSINTEVVSAGIYSFISYFFLWDLIYFDSKLHIQSQKPNDQHTHTHIDIINTETSSCRSWHTNQQRVWCIFIRNYYWSLDSRVLQMCILLHAVLLVCFTWRQRTIRKSGTITNTGSLNILICFNLQSNEW